MVLKNKYDKIAINEINNIIQKLSGFKNVNVIRRKKNLGLKYSIEEGIKFIFQEHSKVIILEDDIITESIF